MNERRRTRGRWAPPLVALILATAAYAPALRPGVQLAGRDLFTLYAPLFQQVARGHRGQVSLLRDPRRGAGVALLADPLAQVAYPPALLRAALPFAQGFKLWFLLHTALVGCGAAGLARRLGASPRGACLAAAAGSLAGPVLSDVRTPNLLAAAAWLGFALAGLLDAGAPGPRGRRGVALAGGALGLTLLAGGVEVVLLLGLAVPPLLALAAPPREWARRAAGAGAALLLGAALSGLHLLPCLAWLPGTARGVEGAIPLQEATIWSLHPLRLLELVVPGLGPATLAPRGQAPGWYADVLRGFGPFGRPLHPSLHLGLPILLLAAAGAARGGRRAAGLGLVALLGLLLPLRLGEHTPLFEALRQLPGPFQGWRYPVKSLLLTSVAGAALAGVGLSRVRAARRPAWFGAAAALLLLAPLLDRSVLAVVPADWLETPPPLGARILAEEHLAPRPGRYLRLTRHPGERSGEFLTIRAAHREALREDLYALYGLEGLLVYGPFRPAALDDYLRALQRPAPELFDRARLAEEACVGWVLADGGLERQAPGARVRLLEGEGRLRLVEHTATRIEVELELRTPGRVFLSEGFDPAWQARLLPLHPAAGEEQALPIERAATLFQAVAVPAGAHRLRLDYRPRGLLAGALASVAGLGALLALLLAPGGGPPPGRAGQTR